MRLSVHQRDDLRGLHHGPVQFTAASLGWRRAGADESDQACVIDEGEGGWSPYFSLEDAKKLETVRLALQRGDLAEAARHGRLFELLPVSA